MRIFLTNIILLISIASATDTSKVVETHRNGNISMISYYADTENGLELIKQETFHFTGPKSMVGVFKDGLRDGTWSYWHGNGQIRLQGNYEKGFKTQLWTRWYENGIIATKYYYDNTTSDGKVMDWHIDKECWDINDNECECGENWWDDCENH